METVGSDIVSIHSVNFAILRNNGLGGRLLKFLAPAVLFQGQGKLAVLDFDGDFKPDFATANGSQIKILKNTTAPGSITSASFTLAATSETASTINDTS